MTPAIPLRRVDQFVGLLQPVDRLQSEHLIMSRPDERFGLLIDDIASRAWLRIDFDDPKPLMPPVLFLVSEMPLVGLPMDLWPLPLVFETFDGRFGLFVCGNIEQVQF